VCWHRLRERAKEREERIGKRDKRRRDEKREKRIARVESRGRRRVQSGERVFCMLSDQT
jgi:hypothetical protein